LWIYLVSAGIVGFALNVVATLIVATTRGPGVPSPLLELIYLACWPSALCGVAHQSYFYPHLLKNVARNIIGWTLLGGLAEMLHSAVLYRRRRKSPAVIERQP
jgi:hypothetical protein